MKGLHTQEIQENQAEVHRAAPLSQARQHYKISLLANDSCGAAAEMDVANDVEGTEQGSPVQLHAMILQHLHHLHAQGLRQMWRHIGQVG